MCFFYLRDSRGDLGSTAMFWRLGGGYTSNIDEAEKFDTKSAQNQHDSRTTDQPLECFEVEALSEPAVDMQYLPEQRSESPSSQYVYQIPGKYNGNDICFKSAGGLTFSLSDARIFNTQKPISSPTIKVWALEDMLKIQRRVFHVSLIDHAKMTTQAGIKLSKPKPKIKPVYRCHHCGIFMTEYQYYGHCHKCGGDNRP